MTRRIKGRMNLALSPSKPFSFDQTLAFLDRFEPCRGEYLVEDGTLTAAISVGGTAHAFTLAGAPRSGLTIEIEDKLPVAIRDQLVAHASRFVGAEDDVVAFCEAPYAEARDALLSIRGLGPFSAGAILLRGLGRMDELPWMPRFADIARTLYRRTIDETTIARRYGRSIGYWSFYLMTGVPRL